MSKKFEYSVEQNDLNQLLTADRRFIVPKYQRDYSWEKEHWIDLWNDLIDLDEKNNYHYMGYIVLKKSTDFERTLTIIDGQQRLTTISILILALIKVFGEIQGKDYQEEGAAKNIYSLYIGTKDIMTSKSDTKLQLNRNNHEYYKNYLATYNRQKKLKYSWKLMSDCFDYFYSEIKKDFYSELKLNELRNKIDSLLFTIMYVDDEVNAYSIFETLNSRGVELSTTDLLKNYLFSIVDSEDPLKLDDLEEKWKEVIDNTPENIELSYMFYIYWNGREKLCNERNIFKEVKKRIKSAKEVFDLLNDLCEKTKNYYLLVNTWDSYWNDKSKCREYLETFKKMKLTQIYSMLIFALDILSTPDFEKLLKYLVVICFRYNTICGKNPNIQSVIFNELSIEMIQQKEKKLFNYNKLKQYLYQSDAVFEEFFKNVSFNLRQNSLVKYILLKIEKAEGRGSYDENILSVEHVLPKVVSDNWDFPEDFYNEFACRLGNLYLLEQNINKDCANKSFNDKKEYYKKSIIPSIKELGNSSMPVWDDHSINSRQEKLAKIAKGIWMIE